jgi:hypothetical protein
MNITRETIKSTLRNIMAEEAEYQTFFKKALEKAGKSIPSMSDEEKKEFFNKIDAAWNAKGEKNEELTGNQHKLDVDGDGEIEASDLAALRAGEEANESHDCGCGCGGVTEGGCQTNVSEEFQSKDRDFEKVYAIFDKKDYFNAKGLAKTQIGNFERALQRNDKGAQQILDKFKGDMEKSKEYIIQVISDQKKQQAFEDYKKFKKAVENILYRPNGNEEYASADFIKSRVHNNSQKYTIALYSSIRNKKFTNYKDIHADVDSLMTESVNEGRAFINAAKKAKAEGKTEFEFNGKTYPVTLKETVTEGKKVFRVNPGIGKAKYSISSHDGVKKHKDGSDFFDIEIFKNKVDLEKGIKKYTSNGFVKESVVNEDRAMNIKVKQLLDKGLGDLTKGKPNHQFAVMHVLMGALTDANFHSEAKKVPSIFSRGKYEGDPRGKQDAIGIYEEMGEKIASICKWDGKDIVDAIGFYVSMTIGRPVGEKVEKLVESINETIYLLNNKK